MFGFELVEKDGQPYVAMKALVEGMGLDWGSQHKKLAADASRWGISVMEIPSDEGAQEAVCMPPRKLPGWLMTLRPSRVAHKKSAALIRLYQEECDTVLWDYWTKGHIENPCMGSAPPIEHGGQYPAEWEQDAVHNLEQARRCIKGSYELLRRSRR